MAARAAPFCDPDPNVMGLEAPFGASVGTGRFGFSLDKRRNWLN